MPRGRGGGAGVSPVRRGRHPKKSGQMDRETQYKYSSSRPKIDNLAWGYWEDLAGTSGVLCGQRQAFGVQLHRKARSAAAEHSGDQSRPKYFFGESGLKTI